MVILLAKYLYPLYSDYKCFSCVIFRALISLLTAFIITLTIGKYFIMWFKKIQFKQIIRNDGPTSHFNKYGTPTMGGIIIIIGITSSAIIWTSIFNFYVMCFFFIFFSYAAIGFVDDYKKIIYNNTVGMSPKYKYFWQSIIALFMSYILYVFNKNISNLQIIIPFFTITKIGLFYLILSYFVIVGSSNAVNLTDGLDGLAIVPIIFIAVSFAFISFISGNDKLTEYFNVIYLKDTQELVVICTSIIGACLGFLWFNAYPAKIFMGDVGSLSLGAGIGIIAILIHQELLLLIIGGLFVAETISVILQVGYFKLYKKRIFLMAPIHHHYELKGIAEPLITVRLWIVSFLLFLISLTTLVIK